MLGVIINPLSGKSALRAQRLYLWKTLQARHIPFDFQVTRYAGHAEEIARTFVEDCGYRRLLVLGGDGTLSEVVNGIMHAGITDEERKKVTLSIVPRGTGNDYAKYWGLTTDYKKAIERFLCGQPRTIDIGRLEYTDNEDVYDRYFINSVGFGVDALCCVKADRLKERFGSRKLNYVIGLVLAIKEQPAHAVTLYADDKKVWQDRLFTMNIGIGPYSGGGIRQNPLADPTDGIFHAMCARKPSAAEVRNALRHLKDGSLTSLDFIHTFPGKEVRLETEQTFCFETDGRTGYAKGNCNISCLHGAIQICC